MHHCSLDAVLATVQTTLMPPELSSLRPVKWEIPKQLSRDTKPERKRTRKYSVLWELLHNQLKHQSEQIIFTRD